MSLLKTFPSRSNKERDKEIIQKSTKKTIATPTVRGGDSVMSKISSIVTLVGSKLSKYTEEYESLRDEQSVVAYFDKLMEKGIAAIDTETDSLDPLTCNLAGVGVYSPGLKPAYIPVGHISYVTGIKSNNQVDVEVLKSCLQKGTNIQWIMHNGKFDTRVIKHTIGAEIKCYWDTSLAARCLNENESYSLKNLHLKYCNSKDTEALTYEKLFEGIPFPMVPISTGYLYAAGDPLKTFELYEFQKKYLNRRTLPGPYEVFSEIEMPLIPAVAKMEDDGIAFDRKFSEELSAKYHEILQKQEAKFYEVLSMYDAEINKYKQSTPGHKLSDPININSPTQLSIILYDILKLKSPDKSKPRGTGEEILEALDSPLSKAILDVRTTAKLLSTYIDKMPNVLNPKTGRIHCSYNQYGADTGRFSSSDPNLQNIPSKNKEIRKMFTATEGYAMISCDFSQQEPRTLAHMSKDTHLINAYSEGKDIYAWIAQSIYNVPYEECKEFRPDGTKNPEGKKRRDSVKSIILGIMYGRGEASIAEQIGVSKKQAREIINKFFQSFPMVDKFIKDTQATARVTGFVETAWGRKRRLPDMLLDPYVLEWLPGKAPKNFDPLAFDSVSLDRKVPDEEVRYFTTKLQNCYSRTERDKIHSEATQRGIKIIDNTGKIADAERQCVNSIIQGGAADMSKLAMISIYNNEELKNLGYRMLIPVHDEIIGEAPIENAKRAGEIVCKLMIEAAAKRISVPMKVDAEITDRWYGEEVEFE